MCQVGPRARPPRLGPYARTFTHTLNPHPPSPIPSLWDSAHLVCLPPSSPLLPASSQSDESPAAGLYMSISLPASVITCHSFSPQREQAWMGRVMAWDGWVVGCWLGWDGGGTLSPVLPGSSAKRPLGGRGGMEEMICNGSLKARCCETCHVPSLFPRDL